MANCIARAETEVFLGTNFWIYSDASTLVTNAFRELSKRAGGRGTKVVVKMIYDRGDPRQAYENRLDVPEKKYTSGKVQLPPAEEVPNIDLQVVNYHRPILGTFHAKFMVVDRRIALLQSSNIQDNDNLEMMVRLEGPIVDAFYDTALISWGKHFDTPFPMLSSPAAGAPIPSLSLMDVSHKEEGQGLTLPEHTTLDQHYDLDLRDEARRVNGTLKPRPGESKTGPVTRHLNTTTQPNTTGDAPDVDQDTSMTPYTISPPHEACPMALVNREPWGAPNHTSVYTPQNAAFLSAIQNAEHSIFIQTPNMNAEPLLEPLLEAVRRGVVVTCYLCLGYNDAGQLLPFQNGTNEMISNRLYSSLEKPDERSRLRIYNYVAKDQTKPIHNKFKRRSCHIKLMIIDGKVAIQGNGNLDTQSFYHSQEVNILIDSPIICRSWLETINRNQNTGLYGAVSPEDGCWHDASTGEVPEGSIGVNPGRFSWAKGVVGAVQRRYRPRVENFTIGWICPLPLEYAAAKSLLDELYDESEEHTTGRIYNHEIVITCLPAGQMGTNAAAAVAARMVSRFPSLKAGLLVGIAGGVPSDKADIRLGDVVIGQPEKSYGGVVQYDFGKTIMGGFQQRIGSLNAPSPTLLTAVSKFKSNLSASINNIQDYLDTVAQVKRPDSVPDVLFEASYDHARGETCHTCRKDMLVRRPQREDSNVRVHFGTIGSGNQLLKDGMTRDKISTNLGGVLCFEMEAAGVVNLLPCLVVRGISDYADSHKNKDFQHFAAATAAACARQILFVAIEHLHGRSLMCFIDALDECDEDQVRDMLSFFEQLGELAVARYQRLLICFSSRHYPHIAVNNATELVLEDQDGHQQDISNFVHSELRAGRSKQVEQIKEEVIARSSGVFLWVVLVVQTLNKEYDRGQVHALKRRMEQIPDGLHELLKDILIRGNHDMENTLLCLQWLLYTQRPLSSEELYFAILAGIESSAFLAEWTSVNVNEEDVNRFILDSSKGLAEVTKSKSPTVQFIHESVRDFLRDERFAKLNVGSVSPGPSHETLKNCCLNYVKVGLSSVPLPGTLPPVKSSKAKRLVQKTSKLYPFLEYSVQYVLYHANAAAENGVTQMCFLQDFPLSSWIMKNNLFEKHEIRRYTPAAQRMYILAEKDYWMLLEAEIKLHHYQDARTERYDSPLVAAIMHSSREAVRTLLTMDANTEDILNQSNSSSRPILSMASQRSDAEMIRILLDHGAIVDQEGATGRTSLSYAATSGNEAIVKLLLDCGANVDSKCRNGRTPLSYAAKSGHEGVVTLLLDRGADINSKCSYGRTPLSYSADSWRNEALAVLLDRGADLESRDINNCTALYWAIQFSQYDVVEKLLNQGAEMESRGHHGSTPLCQAVRLQHPWAARSLLENGANLESRDDDGRAALSYAVEYGRKATVILLLDSGADVNSRDNSGRTPLSYAAERLSGLGAVAIVELLLWQGADLRSRDNDGNTPLDHATRRGIHDVVMVLEKWQWRRHTAKY
ncbi:Pfs [Aspergillus arachidicola]|uniref:Pfs n=1 Tax=Aspergillus arachidicola TaxID=656916 RepID=A0A2G7FLW3_9EURO|nr:Pfs [Aspergillus arachidicola]